MAEQAKYLGALQPAALAPAEQGRLIEHLGGRLPALRGAVELKQFVGGQSNPTFLMVTPDESYVLRRKPPGAVLASAHQIDREYRVMSALHRAGLPVPEPLAYCDDAAVIGSPFYVMRHVPGRIFLDCSLPDLTPGERAALFDSVNDTLARLHGVDLAAAGLVDYGRPGDYFARQIARWTRQYEASRTTPIPAMDRLIAWLPQALPERDARTTLVHGDYSLHNVIIHPTEPRVAAVIDWELSTTGDPLADFTYHLLEWYRPEGSDPRGTLAGRDLAALGIPTETAYAARYFERTGITAPPDLGYYRAFNLFRVAAIIQGIVGRARDGNANAADAADQVPRVERLAAAAWREAQRLGA